MANVLHYTNPLLENVHNLVFKIKEKMIFTPSMKGTALEYVSVLLNISL